MVEGEQFVLNALVSDDRGLSSVAFVATSGGKEVFERAFSGNELSAAEDGGADGGAGVPSEREARLSARCSQLCSQLREAQAARCGLELQLSQLVAVGQHERLRAAEVAAAAARRQLLAKRAAASPLSHRCMGKDTILARYRYYVLRYTYLARYELVQL